MKKRVCILLAALAWLLCGCIMVIPGNDAVGEPKTFEKAGIKLTLTDRFQEQESQLGFDAYYVADFGAVIVLKEPFSLEPGLEEKSVEDYIRSVIKNNGRDVEPIQRDGLWYYYFDSGDTRMYSYTFKGSDAFYIVQFGCFKRDVSVMEDMIFLWAKAVEVE